MHKKFVKLIFFILTVQDVANTLYKRVDSNLFDLQWPPNLLKLETFHITLQKVTETKLVSRPLE